MIRSEAVELLEKFSEYVNEHMDVFDPKLSGSPEINGFLEAKWAKDNITMETEKFCWEIVNINAIPITEAGEGIDLISEPKLNDNEYIAIPGKYCGTKFPKRYALDRGRLFPLDSSTKIVTIVPENTKLMGFSSLYEFNPIW